MIFERVLERAIKMRMYENKLQCIKDLKNRDAALMKKIDAHIKRNYLDFTTDAFCEEISSNAYLIDFFVKSPLKQNICECEQIRYISSCGVNVYKPTSHLYVIEGGNAKSIDAIISSRCASREMACYLKHTTDTGGSQDNQFNDIKNFVADCDTSVERGDNRMFAVIYSGSYYTDAKIDHLKTLIKHVNRIFITHVDDVAKLVNNL